VPCRALTVLFPKALHDLTHRCNTVAEDFLDCLQKLTAQKKKKSTWASVIAALKTIWSKEHIAELAQQLSGYREELTLRILLLLNSYYAKQDVKLELLEESSKEIVEIVSINCGSIQSKLDEHHLCEQRWQEKDRESAEQRHAETIAAILTARDGSSRTITVSNYPAEYSRAISLRSDAQTTTYKGNIDRTLNDVEDSAVSTSNFTSVIKRIEDALHFRTITDRRATVPRAHKRTFEWAYHQPIAGGPQWDNLSDWLTSGTGCYWIAGKAGSGKSTLMKFLEEDNRTRTALQKWAGSSDLILGSFFFWYAGTKLQKSQTGLLRSLLLDVIRKRPELTLVLFPELCRSLLAGELQGVIQISETELQKGFRTFVDSLPERLKVCFLIDGVDEYEGDYNELCDLFSYVSKFESVKLVLSSRPIPACVHHFLPCPKLHLQDLTYNDTKRYVEDKLGHNLVLARMDSAEPGVTNQLVQGITSKASGVFLWVILAVRSLTSGLQDYDTTSDLLRRLEELPPDLEKLYERMLGAMSTKHRTQGSRMLQLVLRSNVTHEDYPMTVLQLSFAEEERDLDPLTSPISAIAEDAETWRREATEGRMRSRCCGLIEVQRLSTGTDDTRSIVNFFHRTVVEFLRNDVILRDLLSLTQGMKFDVDLVLVSSALLELKAIDSRRDSKLSDSATLASMLRMLAYERNMRNLRADIRAEYLPEMVAVMRNHWHDSALYDSPEDESRIVQDAIEQVSSRFQLTFPLDLLLKAAVQCPASHINSLTNFYFDPYEQHDRQQESSSTSPGWLAAYLLMRHADETSCSLLWPLSKNIAALSQPNKSISFSSKEKSLWELRWPQAIRTDGSEGWSLWEFALYYAHSLHSTDFLSRASNFWIKALTLLDIVFALLIAGANVNVILSFHFEKGSRRKQSHCQYSPFAVVKELLLMVWDEYNIGAFHQDVAEKAYRIEQKMRSNRARIWIRDSLLTETNPEAKNSVGYRYGDYRDVRYLTKPGPWVRYIEEIEHTKAAPPQQVTKKKNLTLNEQQTRWDYTPRGQRIELLDPEAKELALQLSRADLTAREKRSVISRVTNLNPEQQSKVWECSRAVEQTKLVSQKSAS
jgi:hypothetical protein